MCAREFILRCVQPILTADLFAPINDELLALLRGLDAADWSKPTSAGAWTVKDVAAHMLDTTLRRLAMHRDGWEPPLPPDAFDGGLGAFVNNMNRDGVAYWSRASPALLIELHETYGRQMAEFLETLDPHAPAKWAVSWAGDEESPMWFDVARELTERWIHQQQIRDAVGAPPLYDPRYFGPVLDAFMLALPYTYREVDAPEGTAIEFKVDDRTWLLRRGERWELEGQTGLSVPHTTVKMSGDTAWRLFTKGLTREEAARRTTIAGDYGDAVLSMLCIVA